MEEVVRARIDTETKNRATAALSAQGMSVSDAIRLLMLRIADRGRLPFVVAVPVEHQDDSKWKEEAEKWELLARRWESHYLGAEKSKNEAHSEIGELCEEIKVCKANVHCLELALVAKHRELEKTQKQLTRCQQAALKKPATGTGS